MSRSKAATLLLAVFAFSCAGQSKTGVPETIIGMERAALDRWGKGDPQGYLEIMAPEITYFDPSLAKRIDGHDAMKKFLAPITGKVKIDNYDMIGAKVQHHGDVALLTFNLVSNGRQPDGSPITVRWNSTETYARINGAWRIIHSHWSFTQPELKQ
jgi:ketosteroid isomerase-like protein